MLIGAKISKLTSLKLAIISMLIFSIKCLAHAEDYSDLKFITYVDRDKGLIYYYKMFLHANNEEEKRKYATLYFRAFPRKFEDLYGITHIGEFVKGTIYRTYLYEENYFFNPWAKFHMKEAFIRCRYDIPQEVPAIVYPECQWLENTKEYDIWSVLELISTYIPQEIFYNKMIATSIDGIYDGRYIYSFQCFLRSLLKENLDFSITLLEKKNDEEIKSFWYFFYDTTGGDKYLVSLYSKLFGLISQKNTRIANCMKEAYEYVMSRDDKCQAH